MKHEVTLRIFQDDTDTWGVTHLNTTKHFNAFWNAIGIFHDVFEHYFEETGYFKGMYSFNIGGEVVAMGHLAYFINGLGLHKRAVFGPGPPLDDRGVITTTQDLFEDACIYGKVPYGDELLCNVPYQRNTHINIESLYNHHVGMLEKMRQSIDEHCDDEDKENARRYRKSLAKWKLQRLYRYGYRKAEKLVPDNGHNNSVLSEFLDFWTVFCKRYSAEEVYNSGYEQIKFTITKKKGEIQWKAELISIDSFIKNINVKEYDGAPTYEEGYY